jgi:DNA-binding NarL/FixJ family response regulator
MMATRVWRCAWQSGRNLVLLDLELPGMDGMELAGRLVAELPGVRLLAMSGLTDPHTIWRASQSRVHGYLEKTAGPELLLEAIQTVARDGVFYSKLFTKAKHEWLSQPEAFQKLLSKREQEVLCRMTGRSALPLPAAVFAMRPD